MANKYLLKHASVRDFFNAAKGFANTAGGYVSEGAKAAWSDNSVKSKLSGEVLAAAGKLGLGLAVGAGVYGLSKAKEGSAYAAKKVKYLYALRTVQERNPVLKSIPVEELRKYGDTLFNFAPSVVTDPNMLSTLLINAVHGEGIDLTTIKTLVDLEDKYSGKNNFQISSMIAKG